jgi:glucose/arabinose dehydrogenase
MFSNNLSTPILLLYLLVAALIPAGLIAQVSYENAFPNITFNTPVELQNAGDGSNRLFVVEQQGVIKVFPNTPSVIPNQVTTFLDIRQQVAYSAGQEVGLLGLAFHPQFTTNGFIFLYYIDRPSTFRVNIVRYQVDSANPNTIDPSSETIIAQYTKNQTQSNHNGGKIAFGPDGYLYISVGDGGGGGDPQGNGQNLNTVFGSILRIDIDVNGDNPIESNTELPNGNYEIPTDNPRVEQTGLNELYAWGIRNTWKFSFDASGRLWGADVGQNAFEEINIISNGGNYGWNRFEANGNYQSGTTLATNPDTKPIFSYNHNAGDKSITGGYVYQGSLSATELVDKYIYGDYLTGRVWALSYDEASSSATSTLLFRASGQSISSFGEDEAGELYFLGYGNNANLFKLTETQTEPTNIAINGVGEWKGITNGTNGTVETILQQSDNTRYVGGNFSNAGGIAVSNLALITADEQWEAFGTGTNGPVFSIAIAPNGNIFVGGDFTQIGGTNANNIAFWNGTVWSALASGTNGAISKLKFDQEGSLYVGGVFTQAGGFDVNYIAKWQNSSWSALADSTTGETGTNNEIRSLDFDNENNLYVGGNFDTAGGVSAARIAKWDGANWSALGDGTSGFVQAIEIVGNYVYAGGNFNLAGNTTANRIARWSLEDSEWQLLGNGLSGTVNSIVSNGDFIYIGGDFETASDTEGLNKIVNNVARWSAVTGWEALGPNLQVGVNSSVETLYLSETTGKLSVGGNFSATGGQENNNIAIWGATFCSEDSVIPQYQVNGVLGDGNSTLNLSEGDTLILSMLPNNAVFTITLPNGNEVTGDYNAGEITTSMSGTYTYTTTEGCVENIILVVTASTDEDIDKDGIQNDEDNCDNTPIGETADANGCSTSQKDTDNDGVNDSADTCIDTPSNEAVDANGCSTSQLDDDADGVSNADDICPNTLVGELVDTFGCNASQNDIDNDGVINDIDICNNTPTNETADANGCGASQIDSDNDGVSNFEDECPNTPNGEIVDANGCATSQLDDDNDGVTNNLDQCLGTLQGVTVNTLGCDVISGFPSDQFTITTTANSCSTEANGQLNISSTVSSNFIATLLSPESETMASYDFNNALTIGQLATGTYDLCITDTSLPDLEGCFSLEIVATDTLSVRSNLNAAGTSVTLNLSGAKTFLITLNNQALETELSEVTLELDKDINELTVSSNSNCQETYRERIILKDAFIVYPNPITDFVTIDISNLTDEQVEISLYTASGKLVSNAMHSTASETVTLDTSSLTPGYFFLRLSGVSVNKGFKLVK